MHLTYHVTCVPDNARRFASWIKERGGICLWESINLSNPGASWCTPAQQENGAPMAKPTWQADDTPAYLVTSLSDVGVEIPKEVKRIKINLLQQGFQVVLTDGSSRKVRNAVAEAGEHAFYTFDGDEAVIWKVTGVISLDEWLDAVDAPTPELTPDQLHMLHVVAHQPGGRGRGFTIFRFGFEVLTGEVKAPEWVRAALAILADVGVVEKTFESEVPIPTWSVTLLGRRILGQLGDAK